MSGLYELDCVAVIQTSGIPRNFRIVLRPGYLYCLIDISELSMNLKSENSFINIVGKDFGPNIVYPN